MAPPICGTDPNHCGTVYEEPLVYRYAIRYLFETTSPLLHSPRNQSDSSAATLFEVDDFNARAPANPFCR